MELPFHPRPSPSDTHSKNLSSTAMWHLTLVFILPRSSSVSYSRPFVSALSWQRISDVTAYTRAHRQALWLSVDTAHKHACPHTHTHPHTQADGVRVCVCIRDVYFCKLMCGLPWRRIVLSPRQQSPDVETRCDTKMKETVSSSFNNTFKE